VVKGTSVALEVDVARDRSNKEKQELLGQIRQKDKQIKHLKRELSRALKDQKKIEALNNNFSSQEPEEKQEDNSCPVCPNGKLTEIDLGKFGIFITCSKCLYRKRLTDI